MVPTNPQIPCFPWSKFLGTLLNTLPLWREVLFSQELAFKLLVPPHSKLYVLRVSAGLCFRSPFLVLWPETLIRTVSWGNHHFLFPVFQDYCPWLLPFCALKKCFIYIYRMFYMYVCIYIYDFSSKHKFPSIFRIHRSPICPF